jgi:hypothetical protein
MKPALYLLRPVNGLIARCRQLSLSDYSEK